MTNDEIPYSVRVALGVIDSAINAGWLDGRPVGAVELSEALDGVCDGIAWLLTYAGADVTAKDRRSTADYCRKRILDKTSELAKRVAAGEELSWRTQAAGPRL